MGRKTVPDMRHLNREQLVTKGKALKFPFCTGKSGTGMDSKKKSLHRETEWQVWWKGTIREMKSKGGYLEKYPFYDWEPVKLSEKWCNMLMSAFAKIDSGRMILNVLKVVHLIRSHVNDWMSKDLQQSKWLRTKEHVSWTVAFLVRRWRTELILLISRYAEWLMWSICFAIDRAEDQNLIWHSVLIMQKQ